MADRRLDEAGGPAGGTTGGYIDSFENMPGAQNQPFGAKPRRAFVPTTGLSLTIDAGEPLRGLVCDLLAGPLPEAAVVVRLDRSVEAVGRSGRAVTGSWLVVEPVGSPGRWYRSGNARVEVWSTPPPAEPWLEDDPGVLLDEAAAYAFG